VHLAHTMAIKKYEGLKHSGDETDARYLAHLLRLGILPTGTILPPDARNLRDLARTPPWHARLWPTSCPCMLPYPEGSPTVRCDALLRIVMTAAGKPRLPTGMQATKR
jgi:hypothetical protein